MTPESPDFELSTVIDQLHEGIQVIDREFRYVYLNRVAAAHGRRLPHELIGLKMTEAYPGIEETEMFARLRRVMAEGGSQRMENEFAFPDGSTRWFELHIESLPVGVAILSLDITQRKTADLSLRHAQRMEAVGRLASEVAVTCDATLRDATREASDWLAALEPDNPQRRQGEQLLSELRRAASFLRQLGVYGEQQLKTFEPVSVRRILGDLAPVLERVVGDDIELVYPKTSGAFDVDVEAERVERVLVNVAGYARQRMSNGGQVRIDLATTVVGRRFIAAYPGVRPGRHVLITVAEVSRAVPAVTATNMPGDAAPTSDKPGVDLGALVDLVASCGGHLWIEAERAGDMLLKIHLPARVPEDRGEKGTTPVGSERARRLARWLRDRSSVLTRS